MIAGMSLALAACDIQPYTPPTGSTEYSKTTLDAATRANAEERAKVQAEKDAKRLAEHHSQVEQTSHRENPACDFTPVERADLWCSHFARKLGIACHVDPLSKTLSMWGDFAEGAWGVLCRGTRAKDKGCIEHEWRVLINDAPCF
jgi:hypothetical protein